MQERTGYMRRYRNRQKAKTQAMWSKTLSGRKYGEASFWSNALAALERKREPPCGVASYDSGGLVIATPTAAIRTLPPGTKAKDVFGKIMCQEMERA